MRNRNIPVAGKARTIAVIKLSLQFSGFRVKARHLGHRFEEKVFMYQVLAILSYFWLILPIVRHCTAYGCSNQSNKVGWENIWTCSSLEKYAFGGMLPHTICLSSLLSLLIMTQTPHFHALSRGNRWTAGSTVIAALISGPDSSHMNYKNKFINKEALE